jgi:hypothetical protein
MARKEFEGITVGVIRMVSYRVITIVMSVLIENRYQRFLPIISVLMMMYIIAKWANSTKSDRVSLELT